MNQVNRPRRGKRERVTGRLGTRQGERYSLIPREVLESDSFRAIPHFAVRVLVTLTAQYHGNNNGALGLTANQARVYGLKSWELYAGLKLLEVTRLIYRTRQGHLARGSRICNWFSVTWRVIDTPPGGQQYDAGISESFRASNEWADWRQPDDWKNSVRAVLRKYRGKSGAQRGKISVSRQACNGDTRQAGIETPDSAPGRRAA